MPPPSPGTRRRPVIVGITGASGQLLAQLCIERLLDYGYPLLLVATGPGRRVWHEELGRHLRADAAVSLTEDEAERLARFLAEVPAPDEAQTL